MSSEFTVTAACGVERTFDSRSNAEDGMDTHAALCEECGDGDVEITTGNGGTTTEVVDAEPASDPAPAENDVEDVAEKDIATDPLSVMPSHFVDDIQGVPTINRKGYCVLAEHYGISVESEPVTLPSSTGFEYAEFKATATTEDGATYSGFGSAHVNRGDGDDEHLLAELAETRAMKRAVAWATGVGITAYSEMSNSL